jgi:hypothetical protein
MEKAKKGREQLDNKRSGSGKSVGQYEHAASNAPMSKFGQ